MRFLAAYWLKFIWMAYFALSAHALETVKDAKRQYNQALQLIRQKNYADALPLLTETIPLFAQHENKAWIAASYYQSFIAAMALDWHLEAATALTNFYPHHSLVPEKLRRHAIGIAKQLHRAAVTLVRNRQPAAALELFKHLVIIFNHHSDATWIGATLYNTAMAMRQIDSHERALLTLENVLTLPDDAIRIPDLKRRTRLFRAKILEQLDRHEEALRDYDFVLGEMQPAKSFRSALKRRAFVLMRLGRIDDARQDFNNAGVPFPSD
jgi:tetratricopeptide (TPR) repeat protein